MEKRYHCADSSPSASDYEGTDLDNSRTASEDDPGSLDDFVMPDNDVSSHDSELADGNSSIVPMVRDPYASRQVGC